MSNAEGNFNTEEGKCKKNTAGKLKPVINQPNIKLYTQVVSTPSSSHHINSIKGSPTQVTPNQQNIAISYNRKKRSPPTPQGRQNPPKKINMSITNDNSKQHTEVEEEVEIKDKSPEGPELSEKLKQLQKLLNEDMAKMIEPLKDWVSHIEKSNKILEEKGELISAMKMENDKLRVDCKLIKIKNRKLKDRLTVIENKLLENNIVVQGITDQAWELSSNL